MVAWKTNRKRHLKSEFVQSPTSSIWLNFIYLSNVGEIVWVGSGTTVSKKKRRENLLTFSIRWARAIRKLPDAVVHWRPRINVQKSVMQVQSCCFANVNLLLFSFSRCRRRPHCLSSLLSWSRNFASNTVGMVYSLFLRRNLINLRRNALTPMTS